MAREGIARVLGEKVQEGYLREKEAIALAQMILWKNPSNFFNL